MEKVFGVHRFTFVYTIFCVGMIAFLFPKTIERLVAGPNRIIPIVAILLYIVVSLWFFWMAFTIVTITEDKVVVSRFFGLYSFTIARSNITNIDTSFFGVLYMNRVWHGGKYDFVPYLSRNKVFTQMVTKSRED